MMTQSDFNLQWYYYLSIESDMQKVSRYIEPCKINYNTFSIEFVKILLASCAGLDILFRVICAEMDTNFKPNGTQKKNIETYTSIILPRIPQIVGTEIFCRDMCIKPFEEWKLETQKGTDGKKIGRNRYPDWWAAHNKIKHRESVDYSVANFQNTLKAVAGLLTVNLVVKEHFKLTINTPPDYLRCDYLPTYMLTKPVKTIF
jgi:hypothetical protein